MSKWRSTNSKAIKANMITVTTKLDFVIGEEMGNRFGLLFDRRSHGTMHFIGVFALYVVGDRLQRTLLALSPVDDGSQVAHIELFRNVLAVYGKAVNMVQFIVADNCNTNRRIATKIGVPLKINSLMSQLHQPNNAAELRKLTPLRAKKRNATRRSSTYAMVERYVVLQPHTRLVEAVEDDFPTCGKHRQLVKVLRHLGELDSVCKQLQCESTTMTELRLLFDSVVADYLIIYVHVGLAIIHDHSANVLRCAAQVLPSCAGG
ncbi:unnamed protein product [Phytophthora fragariaefolia]|uniref:Unnamed protein product n=1 Tax=Phytophthora fragariaefolia TaxID=1490495 RepID=A0A9W7CVJ8_9STRA|nr:unnamed protein product [Phytophthora fragariaefolia]